METQASFVPSAENQLLFPTIGRAHAVTLGTPVSSALNAESLHLASGLVHAVMLVTQESFAPSAENQDSVQLRIH